MIQWLEQGDVQYDDNFDSSFFSTSSHSSVNDASFSSIGGASESEYDSGHFAESYSSTESHERNDAPSATTLKGSSAQTLNQTSTESGSSLVSGNTQNSTFSGVSLFQSNALWTDVTIYNGAGTTLQGTTNFTYSGSTTFNGLYSHEFNVTLSGGGTSVSTETVPSTGSSTVLSIGSTSSSTSFGESISQHWQTTVATTYEYDFTTWTTDTRAATEWTTTEGTKTFASDGGTYSETFETVTSGTYVQTDWHVSLTTATTDTGGGMETTMVPITSSTGLGTTDVIFSGSFYPGFAENTVYIADKCNQLYTAGPLTGIGDWCEVFSTVSRITVKPVMATGTSSISGSDSGSSTTQTVSTGTGAGGLVFGQTTQITQAFSSSNSIHQSTYSLVSYSVSNAPATIDPQFEVRIPMNLSGWQPVSGMQLSDNVYSTYTIHVDTRVTDTDEIARRKIGATYQRLEVSQVGTLFSGDTLSMQTLNAPQTSTYKAYGGYGRAEGSNTVWFSAGVFSITQYLTSPQTSTTYTTKFSSTHTSEIPRGELWFIAALPESVYSGSSPWMDGVEQILVAEVPCGIPF